MPRTKSVFAKSKTECAAKLKALKAECERMSGKLPQRAKPEMPFGDWLKLWYEAFSKPALRPTTQDGYENRIYQHIIPGNSLCFIKHLLFRQNFAHYWRTTGNFVTLDGIQFVE